MTTLFIFDGVERRKLIRYALKYARENYHHSLIYRDKHTVCMPFRTMYFYTADDIISGRYPPDLQCDRVVVHECLKHIPQVMDFLELWNPKEELPEGK